MSTIQEGHVDVQIENKVATIEFGHPMGNSLPSKILKLLAQTITETSKNKEVHAIVLKSSGEKAFCAGASFDELININDIDTGLEFFSGFALVINAIRTCGKIVIGRVHGKAVGGGVGIAAAVDYCFATKFADIKLSELAVGIGPFVVGPAIERKIGLSTMSQLALDATEWRSASWAYKKGLYSDVFDSVEEMDKAVNTLAEKLANSNPDALNKLKEVFWEGTEHWDIILKDRAEISGTLVLSDFTKNAINKFKKK